MGRGILFFIVYRTRPVLSFRISGQHNITGSRGLCECDLLFSETNQPLMSHVSFLFSTSSSLCLFYLFSPPPPSLSSFPSPRSIFDCRRIPRNHFLVCVFQLLTLGLVRVLLRSWRGWFSSPSLPRKRKKATVTLRFGFLLGNHRQSTPSAALSRRFTRSQPHRPRSADLLIQPHTRHTQPAQHPFRSLGKESSVLPGFQFFFSVFLVLKVDPESAVSLLLLLFIHISIYIYIFSLDGNTGYILVDAGKNIARYSE
ncbi:hypothetical protein ACKS23_00719 [Histoplasma ohiense]